MKEFSKKNRVAFYMPVFLLEIIERERIDFMKNQKLKMVVTALMPNFWRNYKICATMSPMRQFGGEYTSLFRVKLGMRGSQNHFFDCGG